MLKNRKPIRFYSVWQTTVVLLFISS